MVRMDKLLDAWRADPRVEPTVELCAMLTRASHKPGARDVIPTSFIVAFATEAIAKHPKSLEVLTALAKLYQAAGEERHGSAVLEIARQISEDDPRVTDAAAKFKTNRTTRELVSDLPPSRPAPRRTPPPRELDAETFDAPTTPLDPPTEPGDSPSRSHQTSAPAVRPPPRRNDTSHGLAPPFPAAAGSKPTAVTPPPPTAAPAPEPKLDTGPGESNPRRSRTLLGGLQMIVAPAPFSAAKIDVPRVPDAPDSDGDQATGVAPPPDFDDGGAPTAVASVSGAILEAAGKGSSSVKPTAASAGPGIAPVMQDARTVDHSAPDLGEPPTIAEPIPPSFHPTDEPKTSQRDVPEMPTRRPTISQRLPTLSKPPEAPPRSGPPVPRPAPPTSEPAPREGESGKPPARRLAARKPAGRGVGTDDPLMKAALARRNRWREKEKDAPGADDPTAGPHTHAERDVPTRIERDASQDDRPTRSLESIRASRNDDSEEVPTRAGPLAPKAAPTPFGQPAIAAPESQTDVDSLEDAPTRTHVGSRPPPRPPRGVLPPARTIDWARPEDRAVESTPGTLSKQVTQVWRNAGLEPPAPEAQRRWRAPEVGSEDAIPDFGGTRDGAQEVSISSFPTDDSADTRLRPLAPLARPQAARRPDPRVEPNYVPPPPPSGDSSPGRQSVDSEGQPTNVRTYVMRPDESAAASQVDPRAPSRGMVGSGFDETSQPAHYPVVDQGYGPSVQFAPNVPLAPLADDMSSSSGLAPLPAFGPPPGLVTRGQQLGGGQGLDHGGYTPHPSQTPHPGQGPHPSQAPHPSQPAPGFGDMNSFFDPEAQGRPPAPMGSAPPPSAGFEQPLLQALESQQSFYPEPSHDSAGYASMGPPSYSSPMQPSAMQEPLSMSFPGGYGSVPPGGSSPPVFRMDSQLGMSQAPRSKRPTALYIALSVAAVMVAVLVGYASYLVISDYRKGSKKETPSPTAEVDKALFAGGPGDLAHADTLLQALENDHSSAVTLARIHLKMLRSLDVTGQDEGLEAATSAARSTGVTGDQLAGAEVALRLARADFDKIDAIIAAEHQGLTSDPYYQLAVGAALEARGDPRASERYDDAAKLEPRLMSAKVRGIRALILDNRLGDAEKRIALLPESASRTALTALDWVAAKSLGAKEGLPRPATLPTTAEVPRSLLAAYAATSLVDAAKADPSTLSKRGIDEADSPGVAVLFGKLALNRGDVTSAQAGARRALTMGTRYAPALQLLGRAALDLGKFDTMTEIIAKLPEDATRELRALRAYEDGDVDDLASIAGKMADGDPAKAAVVPRLERLKGKAALGDDAIAKLSTSDSLGGDLVAVDALLDRGEIARAKAIVSAWPDAAGKPLRARRYARLLRYEGNLDEALLALSGTTSTATPLTIERMLIEAEIPSHRPLAVAKLAAKPNALDLAPSTAKMLEGYVRARDDDGKGAKDALESVSVPNAEASLTLKMAAAVSFASVHDRRGEQLARDLFATFPANPDVMRAANSYGISQDSKDPGGAPKKDGPKPGPTKRKK